MSTNENCNGIIAQRYIITKDIEETSRDHPIFRECTARGGFRTVFQGLDSCPGLRGGIRSRFCQFRLLWAWFSVRDTRIRHAYGVPANWLRLRLAFI